MNHLTFIIICTVIGTALFASVYPPLWWLGMAIFFGSSIIGCLAGDAFEAMIKGMFK